MQEAALSPGAGMREGLNPEPFCDAFKNGFAFALIYSQRVSNIAQTSGFTLCQRMIGDADQEGRAGEQVARVAPDPLAGHQLVIDHRDGDQREIVGGRRFAVAADVVDGDVDFIGDPVGIQAFALFSFLLG